MAQIFDFAAEVARRKPAPPVAPLVGVIDFFDHEEGGVGVDACLRPDAFFATKMLRRLVESCYFDVSQVEDGGKYFVEGAVLLRDVAAITKAAKRCGVVVHDS